MLNASAHTAPPEVQPKTINVSLFAVRDHAVELFDVVRRAASIDITKLHGTPEQLILLATVQMLSRKVVGELEVRR